MTPLAMRITKELFELKRNRTFVDPVGLLGKLDDVHCFELSQVDEIIDEFGWQLSRQPQQVGSLAFLPAPRTWLEVRNKRKDYRFGILLEEVTAADSKSPLHAKTTYAFGDSFESRDGGILLLRGSTTLGSALTLGCAPSLGKISEPTPQDWNNENAFRFWLYAALALINSPKIVGRRQFMPHRKLERAALKHQKLVGKFPLHGWTEIFLRITPPVIDGGADKETHLTGQRALHFCRSHLRIRLGKLELVSAHWRGDPALGIKRSRYSLVA